ncbi:MAG: heparinase II/III family protein, partial [Desulfobacteraceae bacterium]|nr:heparinase II/III family protein [Desulfobacteraceae bacterium]
MKIANRLSHESNCKWQYLPLKRIIRWQIGKELKATDRDVFTKRLNRIIGDFSMFASVPMGEAIKANILQWANETLEHKFNYLGSSLVKIDPIDWHTDFKSGFTWKKGTFYRNYKTVDLSNNADVKVPWELSRCHHLLWLGEAWLLTKDEKYAGEIVIQIKDWIDDNPLMYSINWTCAMDVAIRAVNWMYAVNMVIASDVVDDKFVKKLYKSLFEHGFFIYNNLEKNIPYSANHYASDITGLLFIGQFLKETRQGKKWWQFALNEYYMEVRQQVLPSGVHFERSISYHRLMTEIFAYPYFMLIRLSESIPLDIHYRIKSMFKFILHYTKPNGLTPVIGDNDDGRLLPFCKYDFRDHRYLLGLAYLAFYDSDFYKYASFGSFDRFLLLNRYYVENDPLSKEIDNTIKSIVFDDAGFAILRHESIYLFFNNSELSKYQDLNKSIHGTHTHSDALSFELSIGDQDFIVDPGSYVYSASQKSRNEFRSTCKHNSVIIDNLDQVEFLDNNLFCVKSQYVPKGLVYLKENGKETIMGTYTWHLNAGETVIQKRSFEITNKKHILIQDDLIFQQPHVYTWHYHFAPELEVEKMANIILLISPSGQ